MYTRIANKIELALPRTRIKLIGINWIKLMGLNYCTVPTL